MDQKRAVLVLEDGSFFKGLSAGYPGSAKGEVVFNTSMTGYQEILTDPSYKGQIVTMTYPLIGNYGCNNEDIESHRPWVEGFVVKELSPHSSNWRKTENLTDYLINNRIVAIQGIDTRRLTKTIREKGALRGLISPYNGRIDPLIKKVKNIPSIVGADLVRSVTTQKPYDWAEGFYCWPGGFEKHGKFRFSVAAYDFGIKRNILRSLASNGIKTLVVPADMPWTDVLSLKPDGVLLSNGPGDPSPLSYAVKNIQSLIGRIPLFGICLGHQLLALAVGAKTYKLKFGHRGANHPVQNLVTGQVEITSQNHGFAVDLDSLPAAARLTHLNLNDRTMEGFTLGKKFAFAVQYHPESSPGPRDSRYLFHQFSELMDRFKEERSAETG